MLVTYAINDRESFNCTRLWIEQVKQRGISDVVMILVGTKSDVDNLYNSSDVHFPNRCVSYYEGKELADSYGIKFFETSARNGAQVQEVFEVMTRDIMEGFRRREARRRAMQSTQSLKGDSDGFSSCLWGFFGLFKSKKSTGRPTGTTSSKSVKSYKSGSFMGRESRGSSFMKEVGRN